MNLDILREYSMLADLLNYGEAANELHISKSALSKHVASLEESVGTELFCRDGSFDLTPAGIAFLNETTSILSHYEHALQKCRAIGKKYPRSLRIEAVSFLYDTAIGVMQRSLRNAADANILQFTQLTDTPSQEMLVSHILSGKCDFALYYDLHSEVELASQIGNDDVCIRKLSEDEIVVVSSPSNEIMANDVVSLSDLTNRQITIYMGKKNTIRRIIVTELFNMHGMVPNFELRPISAFSDSFTPRPDSNDVLLVGKSVLQDPLLDGAFYRPLVTPISCSQKAYGIYRKSNEYPLLQLFLESLEETLGEEPPTRQNAS